jgi:hypothetical protein
MYVTARQWGIQPSEFWDMTMVEWFVEAQFHQGQSEKAPKQKGVLSQAEIDRLSALLEPE